MQDAPRDICKAWPVVGGPWDGKIYAHWANSFEVTVANFNLRTMPFNPISKVTYRIFGTEAAGYKWLPDSA